MATKTIQDADALTTTTPVPVGATDQFVGALESAVPASEYTGGVSLIENKDALIDMPFVIIGFAENEGTNGAYANVRIMLPNNAVVCFNDGGSSILPLLRQHASETGGDSADGRYYEYARALYCARGLRRSDYTTTVNGKEIAATTYHLS